MNARTLLTAFYLFLTLHVSARQETWRSADGQHSFQGEFVRLTGETVTLRGTDGGG